jgi:gamma-glutamylcyclotransferase (GGCT)/AIG2-like uncharacterized protein YtfP
LGTAALDLFVYGTLMAPRIMQLASGHQGPGLRAELAGYRRSRVRGEPYPGIAPSFGAAVAGLLYQGVAPAAVQRLDVFEGEMYARIELPVKVGEDFRRAHAYVVRPDFEHLLEDRPWSFEAFMRDGFDRFVAAYRGFGDIEGCD